MKIQAYYTISELSTMAGWSKRRIRRLLCNAGVEFHRSGNKDLVSLSELRIKIPGIWEAMMQAETVHCLRNGPG